MAHYAFLDGDSIVTQVITGVDEDNTSNLPSEFSSWEEFYADQNSKTCKRTSFNTIKGQHTEGGTPFRGNYAGIGMKYDASNDVFYEQQPHASWTLNTSTWVWEPPVAYPTLTEEEHTGEEVVSYRWDESVTNWVKRTP